MNRLFAPVVWFFHLLARLVRAVFGDVSWRPPGWAGAIRRRPVLSALSLVALLAIAVGGWRTWHWYAHQPKPPSVGWSIIHGRCACSRRREFQPQPLTLRFNSSVAKLESIGKTVTTGVTLSPPLKGKWTWSGGTELVFEPDRVWPAATKFQVKLSPSLFSNHARLETLTKEFRTVPMTVAISDATLLCQPQGSRDEAGHGDADLFASGGSREPGKEPDPRDGERRAGFSGRRFGHGPLHGHLRQDGPHRLCAFGECRGT